MKTKENQIFNIITIKDETGEIEIICNLKENNKEYKELKDKQVEVTGRLDEYVNKYTNKTELQIRADEITFLSQE